MTTPLAAASSWLRPPTSAQDEEHLRLPSGVQQALIDKSHRKTLARGDSLFLKGSMPDALFGVVRGSLRVSVVSPDGREAVIAILEPGHWFGEVSLLVGRKRVYDACALEETEMAVVDATDFHALIATRPDIHMAFTRLVCMRLRQALAWIDDAILMSLSRRLAHRLLTLDSQSSSSSGITNGSEILAVSQEDLAFMLGVSRQSINRQLKQWERDGTLCVRYRCIELLDRTRLEEVSRD